MTPDRSMAAKSAAKGESFCSAPLGFARYILYQIIVPRYTQPFEEATILRTSNT